MRSERRGRQHGNPPPGEDGVESGTRLARLSSALPRAREGSRGVTRGARVGPPFHIIPLNLTSTKIKEGVDQDSQPITSL